MLNPFTPYGDGSLVRIANLYANVAQLSREAELESAFAMVGQEAAAMIGRKAAIEVGAVADLVLFDATDAADAVRRIAPALRGWKAGRESFVRAPVEIRR